MTETINVFDDIEVLEGFILFQFEDDIDGHNRNSFREKTESGIILQSSFDQSTKQPRWGIVVAIGPKVDEDISVGSKILIDSLKWTKISTFSGENFARTENDHVLAIAE